MRFVQTLALVAAVASTLTGVASATSFYSDSSTTMYTGYDASSSAPTSTVSQGTYNLGTGGTWANPVSGSSWISFAPNTQPNGSAAQYDTHAADGYYTYTTYFTSDANAFGYLTVMADDTVSVYLDGTEIISEASAPYPTCSAARPNCLDPYTVALSGLSAGQNQLQFVVHQAAEYATGLDYVGVVATPEPGSLLLLGTGLLTGASTLVRRHRRA